MAKANLVRSNNEIEDGLESKVIVNCLGDIPGGRTLDVTSMPSTMKVIQAGHIIIKSNAGVYKPMPLNGGGTAYASLPSNHSYVGVLKASVSVNDPRAAILTMGQVNQAACPFTVPDGAKTALTHIQWLY